MIVLFNILTYMHKIFPMIILFKLIQILYFKCSLIFLAKVFNVLWGSFAKCFQPAERINMYR